MKKYKVGIVSPEFLPVPAVKGGAIETLITSIVKRHSTLSYIDLTVFSIYNEKAKKIAQEKYSSVSFQWIHSNTVVKKIKKFIFLVIRKITGRSIYFLNAYYGAIFKEIRKDDFDLLIAEGGDERMFKEITGKLLHTKNVFHIHWHCKPRESIKNYYSNIIAVSQFVLDEYIGKCNNGINGYVLKNAIE